MGLLDRFRRKEVKAKKKRRKRVGTSVGTQKRKKKPLETNDILIKEWSQTIKKIENHPLSQARLINTSILEQLTEILTNIDSKLEKLNKLDDIVSLLNKEKQELKQAGMPTEALDVAIAKLKGLSTKDKEALDVLKNHGSMTTQHFAEKSGLTRSTASSRLNKLHNVGLLKKKADGKKISFEIDRKL